MDTLLWSRLLQLVFSLAPLATSCCDGFWSLLVLPSTCALFTRLLEAQLCCAAAAAAAGSTWHDAATNHC